MVESNIGLLCLISGIGVNSYGGIKMQIKIFAFYRLFLEKFEESHYISQTVLG